MSKDYEVGYGKPPKSGRFQKGQSGNPGGKPPGSKGLKTDLREELSQKVEVTENGKKKKITKQRLMVKSLAQKAAKGDTKATSQLVSLIIQSFGLEDRRGSKSGLSPHDQAIFDDFLQSKGEEESEPSAEGAGNGARNDEEPENDREN